MGAFSNMSEPNKRSLCSICGLPLPEGELAQRCPHCLLNLAFDLDPDARTEEPGTRGKTGGIQRRYFGDFELIEQVAQGGMGVVWKARQLSIHRFVALKMIHAGHLASAEARVRFCAEIEATARLDHPNIVPLFETGEHDGVHYFTMKLLTGGDLAARKADLGLAGCEALDARKQRERQAQVAQLVARIARAVLYAHQRGILHRDLKPSNILLDDQGQPHVTDFGLAKLLTRESGFTFTQSLLGSPNYMAPEQAAGKTNELTTATDVYGLGAILYELLAGRPPFQAGSPVATLRQVLDQPPTPPRKLNPAVDHNLETICLKCLEKSPSARYASAGALAEDLECWLHKRPIQARRAGALERGWRWCQREPALAVAWASGVALLLAIAISSSLAAFRIRDAERKTTAALRESLVEQARSLRLSSAIGHRAEGLRLLREAIQLGGPPDFKQRARDELLATVVRADLQFSKWPILSGARDPALNVTDPRLTRLASLVASNTVLVQSLKTGQEIARFSVGADPGTSLEQLSHDGRFLGLRHPDGISIWDAETGGQCFATNGGQRVFCFAPDGSRLILEEWDYKATVFELPSLRVMRQLAGSSAAAGERAPGWSAIAMSPKERTLTVARNRDQVIEWLDVETGAALRRATTRAPIVALAWSPDGTRLAAALSNGRVPVFGRRGGKLFDLPAVPAAARSLAFNSDASLLAVLCWDRVLRVIDTEAVRYAFAAPCDGARIAFDSDGTLLGPLFRGDDLGGFTLSRPQGFLQANIANTRVEFEGCHYSRGGRLLAVGNLTNVVFCNNAGVRLLTAPRWRITAFAFDPQSDSVLAAFTSGLFRWKWSLDDQGALNLTDKQLLVEGRGWRAFAFSADGGHFAAANIHSNAAFVFDRTFTNRLAKVGPHPAADSVAISPGGRWVATGSQVDRQMRVWRTSTGEAVLALPVGPSPRATFSPNGKWLATFGETFALHAVDSWEPAPPLPFLDRRPILGAAAFSPDDRMLAVVCNLYTVQLIDLKTFGSIGLLQMPTTTVLRALQFSPDGTQLAGVGALGRVQFWDLRQLGDHLRSLGADSHF